MKEHYFHEEESFHEHDRKKFRKERRLAQKSDRSKFKKSDLNQQKKEEVPFDDERLHRGRVIAISGEGVIVDVDQQQVLCSLKGLIKKEKMLSKNLIAVGDLVRILPINPKEGSIVYIEDRYSFLSRVDISGKKEQLIAVNVDQVLIVSSIVHPPIKPALIDRYLIAAEIGHLHPIIVINKIDLLDSASVEDRQLYVDFLKAYEPLGYPILSISTKTNTGVDQLRSLMQNKSSVFAGQSGVGKSSLLNAAFEFQLNIGELTQKTIKGSHTTTKAELLPLPHGGFCIDTPGIRSFGIWDLQREDVLGHFREFHSFAGHCRYPDCNHLNEPSCAVIQAMEQGKISPIRYESYRSLMDEILNGLDNRSKRKMDL